MFFLYNIIFKILKFTDLLKKKEIEMFCHPKMEEKLNASPQLIANVTRY